MGPTRSDRFAIGDNVFVLRWLLAGTREGPFPIVDREADGRWVVRYGRHASYAAEAEESDLVHATPDIIDALPRLMDERVVRHAEVDASFAAELRRLGASRARTS